MDLYYTGNSLFPNTAFIIFIGLSHVEIAYTCIYIMF